MTTWHPLCGPASMRISTHVEKQLEAAGADRTKRRSIADDLETQNPRHARGSQRRLANA